MIPEQLWDEAPIRARRPIPGRPTGSAMPPAWAHAEFVKLLMSRELGYCFDRLPAVWNRYRGQRQQGRRAFWWQHARIRSFSAGSMLVIALSRPGVVRYGIDGWRDIFEAESDATGLGFFAATLDTAKLATGQTVDFTVRWSDGSWIG